MENDLLFRILTYRDSCRRNVSKGVAVAVEDVGTSAAVGGRVRDGRYL